MYVFKSITPSDTEFEETLTHTTVNITKGDTSDSSTGITEVAFRSASFNDESLGKFSKSGRHWNSLHYNYYSSGSSQVSASDPYTYDEYSHNLWNNRGWEYILKGQHRNKFPTQGRVLYVPQYYYGEKIKPGSFELNVTTASKSLIIKDDGMGNIYAVSGSEHSQSAATALSSSENYIGNIFYDDGTIIFTETGSWSGSSAIATGFTYPNLIGRSDDWTASFESYHKIFTKTWRVTIDPKEFNSTTNRSARAIFSGSNGQENVFDGEDRWAPGHLSRRLNPRLDATSGSWSPHCTAIALYGEDTNIATGEPLVIAHLSQPIPMDSEVPIVFEISLDF